MPPTISCMSSKFLPRLSRNSSMTELSRSDSTKFMTPYISIAPSDQPRDSRNSRSEYWS